MLTTGHFTLQGARANTASESTARAALYGGALPASLAFGFLWEWLGARGAFLTGATIAALALVLMLALIPADQEGAGA